VAEQREKIRLSGSAAAGSSGVVIGNIQKLDARHQFLPEYIIEAGEVGSERERLRQAVADACKQLDDEILDFEHHERAQELISILQAHRLMLTDSSISEAALLLIQEQHINAERALKKCLAEIGQAFDQMSDQYLRSRKADVEHVGQRIFSMLANDEPISHVSASIMMANDFSPSDVVAMWRSGVSGFVSVQGGADSHAMIVARSIGLPGLSGVQGLFDAAEDGDDFVLDAEHGAWVLHPHEDELADYAQIQFALLEVEQGLQAYATAASTSADGYFMPLMANLEFAEEARVAVDSGAEGVGLFRTEFLFMQSDELPQEDLQFQHYAQVVQGMHGKPVTFRLLDIGADKLIKAEELQGICDGLNPALGLRGVRMLLNKPKILETQLRAMVRAAAFGHVSILIPMVTTVAEVEEVRAMMLKVQEALGFKKHIDLGVMIEVPASVFIANELAQVSDFFSIGSNDLVQYSLAVDRADEQVGYIYNSFHPAITTLIGLAAEAAHRHEIAISVCGELAANPDWTQFFLDVGMTSLSMGTRNILPIRKQLSELQQNKRIN